MPKNRRICILSLSFISQDSRVLRQIEYLSKKYHLTVIGYGSASNTYKDSHKVSWKTIRLPKNKTLQTFVKVFVRLIQIPFFPKTHPAYHFAETSECDVYLANNWDSLPVAALSARHDSAKLVLDLHESYDSWYWGLITPLVKLILRKYASEVDASSTVVQQLADQHRQFGLNPIIIRNIPKLPVTSINFSPTNRYKIRLIHHGVASSTRSSDLMIRAIALCEDRYELHLVFTNHQSKYVASLKRLSLKIAPDRVSFYPPFSPQEIIKNISEFDIGFFPLPPKNYNYQIALPNKLFEFIAAGLAVVIGPSPNMAAVLQQYRCGIISSSFEPEDLAKTLNKTSAETWDSLKRASIAAASELNADTEMSKLALLMESFRKSSKHY